MNFKEIETLNSEINNLYPIIDKDYNARVELSLNRESFVDKKTIGQAKLDDDEKKLVDDFIRLFVDKIVVSKVKNDRHNIKIDIYLNVIKTGGYSNENW